MAERCRIKLPCLPVRGKAERSLFKKLLALKPDFGDGSAMALEWCEHVDGAEVFPKLPVYLRNAKEAFAKNQRVQDAVEGIESGLDV